MILEMSTLLEQKKTRMVEKIILQLNMTKMELKLGLKSLAQEGVKILQYRSI
jgi:hypothetical protein